jgi:hypothetical protein
MPFEMGFISLSEVESIPPEILKMLNLLGTCGMPTFLMSRKPKEAIQHLREQRVAQLFDATLLGVDNQVEVILDKLSSIEKPPRRGDVFYLSDQPSAVELARKIGLSAFYFDAKSAPSITSFLRVNM